MNLLTTILFCMLSSDLPYHDNFLANTSFEEDLNRDELPDHWTGLTFDSAGTCTWDQGTSRTGSRSLRLDDPGDAGPSDWKDSTVRWTSIESPVAAGETYTLEAWIRTKQVAGRARLIISWLHNGSYLDQAATEPVTGTQDWTAVSVRATAPEKANGLRIFCELSSGNGTAWFDDLHLAGRSRTLPDITYVFHDTDDWFSFEFPGDDTNRDSIDLSRFLDAPAGKHGFVTVQPDGHFYFENGQRARFFGTNLGGAQVAPPKEVSRVLADRLAKYGANMIRLHSIDGMSTRVVDYGRGDSRHFDAEVLDRMDYLIAQLKRQGIYVYLDLLDYRMFRTKDGVKFGDELTHNWAGSMKGASIFDPRMIELQKDYATKLLTHRNPYTGLRYLDDPAIALLEITNENSVFYFLLNAELSHPYYREQLRLRWNTWLARRYTRRQQWVKAWTDGNGRSEIQEGESLVDSTIQLPAAELVRFSRGQANDRIKIRFGPARMRDALEFLGELQTAYYRDLRTHLKDRLGVRIPLTGTNQTFVLSDTFINARASDFISRNQYWRHPSRNAKPFFRFANEPMVGSDLVHERGPFTVFGSSAVAGMPMVLAEFNFPWPNEYRAEGLLAGAAYACLQDWDAILLFSFGLDGRRLEMFRSHSDPARWGTFPAAALLFHRHDVDTARNEIHELHTAAERRQLQPDERYAPTTNFRYLTFLSKARRLFLEDQGDSDGSEESKSAPELADQNSVVELACGRAANAKPTDGSRRIIRIKENSWDRWLYDDFVRSARELKLPGYETMRGDEPRFVSDTGQLTLDFGQGLFVCQSPRTIGAIGRLPADEMLDLGAVQLNGRTPFAVVFLQSLDGLPIGSARRLLVTAVAKAENTAQGFWPGKTNPKSWSPYTTWMLPAEGREPVICQPVDVTLTVKVPAAADVRALDPTGRPVRELEVTNQGGRLTFDLSSARSIWCEIRVD